MSSLQEQLLKAGLVDENRIKQANKEKNKRNKQTRKTTSKAGARKPDAKTQAAKKRQAERVARDRALEDKRKKALEQKAVAAQVKQLIDSNKIARSGGEIAYSFVYRKKIKKMYVDEKRKRGLPTAASRSSPRSSTTRAAASNWCRWKSRARCRTRSGNGHRIEAAGREQGRGRRSLRRLQDSRRPDVVVDRRPAMPG